LAYALHAYNKSDASSPHPFPDGAHIRSKQLSPVELLNAHFRQIEKHNPQFNAFIHIFETEARTAAQAAEDSQAKGEFPALVCAFLCRSSPIGPGSPRLQ
jgi:Asp-tRNA(Asn)/Glu-tRNA(Gln) amidotransferase A subunit family amidase